MKLFSLGLMMLVSLTSFSSTSCSKRKAPILILGAEKNEHEILEESLTNCNKTVINGFTYNSGTIDGYPVVVGVTDVGMTNASISATLGIQNFNPYCVIDQGTAGGHHIGVNVGDIVVGKYLKEIGYYKLTEDGKCEYLANTPEYFCYSDNNLLEIANNTTYRSTPDTHPDAQVVKNGTIGTCDQWNHNGDYINSVHEIFGTDCEEMETYSVALTCEHFSIPFLGIRIVSNSFFYPQETKDYRYYGQFCQQYVLDVTRNIIKTLA